MRVGIVRGISYGLFGPPDEFVPQARALGAGLVRSYVYWGQVEPEPGRFVWDSVDALLDQLDGDVESWVTVCSSSPWATRERTDFLPPSPAVDLDRYSTFVRRLVDHCDGKVRYWQCDNEPSNAGLLWAGTAEEYVAQLVTMHAAVRESDPDAYVVLGGCGYDVLGPDADPAAREFFDHVADAGRAAFDLFSVNLYGTPSDVPRQLAKAQQLMSTHGYTRPLVVGEHGGPVLFEFPELETILQGVFAEAFSADQPTVQSTEDLRANLNTDTPERRAMLKLYDRMPELPPRLQMFMAGCPAELEAKRHRIASRQVVTRTLFALATGVRRTACWNLAPEVPGANDPYQMMSLMFGKLSLMDYEGRSLNHRYPAAESFAELAGWLDGARSVHRVEALPGVFAFEIDRGESPPSLVLWEDRDTFSGEEQPPTPVTLQWRESTVQVDLTDTPVYLS